MKEAYKDEELHQYFRDYGIYIDKGSCTNVLYFTDNEGEKVSIWAEVDTYTGIPSIVTHKNE